MSGGGTKCSKDVLFCRAEACIVLNYVPQSLSISFFGLLLATFNVWAGTSALEGIVKDPTGRPIKGADVRIEARNFAKIVKTDANGR